MLNKKKPIFILLLFCCIIISMSFASANNITVDNNDSSVVNSPTKSFTDLNDLINDDLNKSEIILEDDYVNQKGDTGYYYRSETGVILADYICINRSVTINGQGHVIDANELSGIFCIDASNVKLKNIIFKNSNQYCAVDCFASNMTLINCTFINNTNCWNPGAISCLAPNANIINSTFINNYAQYDNFRYICSAIRLDKGGRIINCNFTDNYMYKNDEEKYAGIYYPDITFNVVNESISYSLNNKKVSSVVSAGNVTIINSTFKNTLTHEIHYDEPLITIFDEDNNTNHSNTETTNNSTSTNQSTTENNTNITNNTDANKTTENNIEQVIPVNVDADTNMSQITPTIDIIANNTYVINSAEDIIEIGFKTNIKNKMFWVEVIGLLSKTNITSNDNFHATIKLTNITKEGEYTILCGFNDYVKPVATGSDDIGVDDKKTIQIKYNKNNQPTAENSTITDNNTVPSNPDANKTSQQPVKTLLLLKPVSVKKSAKKLVLQIVLKQNKKVLKGKKITFIFNGKKYTAKTNKKGIAKVTIKKNILKKLKAGKKVKYQVKYGKTVSRKTLIVNK